MRKVEKRHTNSRWKRQAVIVTLFVLAMGALLQTGRLIKGGGKKKESENPNQATQKPTKVVAPNHMDKMLKDAVEGNLNLEGKKTKKIKASKLRNFVEGDGKHTVTDGNIIYSGEGKDIVIQKYASNKVTELARVTVNQIIRDFYLFHDRLVCIASNQAETTITVYEVSSQKELKKCTTLSVEGEYQCSYEDEGKVFIFTNTGNIEKLDVINGKNIPFSVKEKNAKYFVEGEFVYTLKKSDKGTRIQSYQFQKEELQMRRNIECNVLLDHIMDIRGSESKLELLVGEKDGVRLQQYDQQMRLVDEKKNVMGEQIFAGKITKNGILVFGNDATRIQLSMLYEKNLETLNSVLLENVESIVIGNMILNTEESKVGFATRGYESNGKTYCLYKYSEDIGFSEIGTKQLEVKKVENEFIIGDCVLQSDSEGVEVLLD